MSKFGIRINKDDLIKRIWHIINQLSNTWPAIEEIAYEYTNDLMGLSYSANC